MRTFEQFPEESTCPICGTNKNTYCFLAAIDGTQDGNISEAQPVHVDCLLTDGYQFNKDIGIIYKHTGF